MKINLLRKPGLEFPTKGHPEDAGWDIRATSEPKIVGTSEVFPRDSREIWKTIDYIEYETDIQYEIEKMPPLNWGYKYDVKNRLFGSFWFLDARPRSSISSKTWLTLCNTPSTLDWGYRGKLILRYRYNYQPTDLQFSCDASGGLADCLGITVNYSKIYKAGDAIAQLVPMPNVPIEWNWVDKLDDTARGDGGFGSTDQEKAEKKW